jgi:hypothetical protein
MRQFIPIAHSTCKWICHELHNYPPVPVALRRRLPAVLIIGKQKADCDFHGPRKKNRTESGKHFESFTQSRALDDGERAVELACETVSTISSNVRHSLLRFVTDFVT